MIVVINLWFKSPSCSLLLLGSIKFLSDVTSLSQQGSYWKDPAIVEFTFTRGFGHISEAAFTLCGNPNKVTLTGNSPQQNFRFTWPAWLLSFAPANFEKRWLCTTVGHPQKTNFSIEKNILRWKSTIDKATFQSNFKF